MTKDMRKGLAFILVCGLLFLGLNELYRNCTFYRSIEGIYRYEDVPFGLELVNFGSSHGEYGLDYSDFQEKYACFNFAFTSQILTLDASLLETYKEPIIWRRGAS